jgi:hypothetical protein
MTPRSEAGLEGRPLSCCSLLSCVGERKACARKRQNSGDVQEILS